MSRHTREQFVRLHEQPLLNELHTYFQVHYGVSDATAGHWRSILFKMLLLTPLHAFPLYSPR